MSVTQTASVCLPNFLAVSLYVYLLVCLSIRLSLSLSVCLPVCERLSQYKVINYVFAPPNPLTLPRDVSVI